jgi:hypothetical protein
VSIRKFIIFTVICVSPLLAQNSEPAVSSVTKEIRDVANKENIPNAELEKAYSAYKGAYQYGRIFEFRGSQDFGEVFDKMREVTSDTQFKSNQKLSDAAYAALKEFEKDDMTFNQENKDKFLEKVNEVAEGLKQAMEKE